MEQEQTFTPGQAYDLTGVEPANQRLWRSKDIFRPQMEREGWTRYTLVDIVKMAAIKRLVDGGMLLRYAGDATSSSTFNDEAGRSLASKADGDKFDFLLVTVVDADEVSQLRQWHGMMAKDLPDLFIKGGERMPIDVRILNISEICRQIASKVSSLNE